MSKKTYYVTTPIYYPSGKWHLGSAYTTVLADAVARYRRLDGYEVFFLTGTDEHGMKIEKKALENGQNPKEYVDGIVANLKKLWEEMNISYDKFIRTTDKQHIFAVQKIFTKLYEKGDIYKSQYEGWYCVPCESFWTETQAAGGKCPDCGREVVKSKEESYFFRLSKYADRLLKLYEEQPDFLLPKTRVNEMINNFIKPGLEDLAVSRTSFKWGIPVPFDDKHVIYVWIDALSNYITALGYGGDEKLFNKFWPADVHLMAKEIVRFHAIIWPALLMALDLPLPKKVYGHGWLMMGGDKLSKSKSENVKKDVIDPFVLISRYGADALRYVLLKEGPYSGDTPYTNETLLSTINSDLANDLGNLFSRTSAMITQYFEAKVPQAGKFIDLDNEIIGMINGLRKKISKHADSCDIPSVIREIFIVIRRANKYIDETMPWQLNKTEEGRERLKTVLYVLAETLRVCAIYLLPIIPSAAQKILDNLGISEKVEDFENTAFGGLKSGSVVTKGNALFPRLDMEKETRELEQIAAQTEQKDKNADKKNQPEKCKITIEEFSKTELRTATVIAAEKVEKADKLLKLTLKAGNEIRTVVSGIAKYYTCETIIGKTVVFVANLVPARLKGITSEGMILCAEDSKGNLAIISPDKEMESGSTVR
jgi:methionyl-tRNA synthetase